MGLDYQRASIRHWRFCFGFVYLSGQGGKEIIHVGRAGDVRVESVELYLFSYPFFQLALFLIPLMIDLNWRRFQRVIHHSEQHYRAQDARYQAMDTVLLYVTVCCMIVTFELVVLGLALAVASSVYWR